MKMGWAQMVARFSSMRPIMRLKHVVDSQTAIPINTQVPVTLIAATDTPDLATTTGVTTGATVNAFYTSVEIVSSETDDTATPNFYAIWVKNPGGGLTFANGNAVGANDNKKYVIHQEMVMYQPLKGGVPRNVFKGVLKIPKHMKRFGPNDLLQLIVFIPSTGTTVNMCTQTHFKEFR